MEQSLNKERPRYLVLWRHNGENYWEAVSQRQFKPLLEKLIAEDKVNPASIIISGGAMVNWLFPEYHKNCRTLWLDKLYDEINGTSKPSDYNGPNISPKTAPAETNTLYGWVSPDGRYFHCEYGGHAELARKIVGSIQKVDNAQNHLEQHGWLAIYKDPLTNRNYSVGMGVDKILTDEQAKTLLRIGLPTNTPGLETILK